MYFFLILLSYCTLNLTFWEYVTPNVTAYIKRLIEHMKIQPLSLWMVCMFWELSMTLDSFQIIYSMLWNPKIQVFIIKFFPQLGFLTFYRAPFKILQMMKGIPFVYRMGWTIFVLISLLRIIFSVAHFFLRRSFSWIVFSLCVVFMSFCILLTLSTYFKAD